MKKIVSLLLALVMVLSLGVAAFAVDAEDANTTTTEEATPTTTEEAAPTVTIDEILAWVKDTILPEINLDLMKEVIKQQYGLDMGGVRAPLANLIDSDKAVVDACSKQIQDAIAKYC